MSSGLVLGRRPLGAILHSSNEPGERSQWLCHDYSTINIVLVIIIIIINQPPWSTQPGHPSVGRCIEYQIRLGR